MPLVSIDLTQPSDKSKSSLDFGPEDVVRNAYLTENGIVRSRPGAREVLSSYSGTIPQLTRGWDSALGMYYWSKYKLLCVLSRNTVSPQNAHLALVSGSKADLYEVSSPGDSATGSVQGSRFQFVIEEGSGNISFPQDKIFFTTDNYLHCWKVGTGLINPTNIIGLTQGTIKDVDRIDQYCLVSLQNSNTFRWSNINDFLLWPTLNFANAEGNIDAITRLKVFEREIYLFGSQSLEVWQNDGVSPFSRIPGAYYEVGCPHGNSVCVVNRKLYFLDHTNRISIASSRGVQQVQTNIDEALSGLGGGENLYGYAARWHGRDYYILRDVLTSSSYAIDVETYQGMRLSNHTENGVEVDVPMKHYLYVEDHDTTYTLTKEGSKIGYFDDDTHADHGQSRRVILTTSTQSNGNSYRKRCKEFRMDIQRGFADIGREPTLQLRYSDNGQAWSNWRDLGLGNIGDRRNYIRCQSLGMFRNRKWQLSVSDPIDVAFSKPSLEVDFLGP